MPSRRRDSEPMPPPPPDPRLHQPTDPDSEDRPLPTDSVDDIVIKALRANARHSATASERLRGVGSSVDKLTERVLAVEVAIAPIVEQSRAARGVAADTKKFLDSKTGERLVFAVYGLILLMLNNAIPQIYAAMVAK